MPVNREPAIYPGYVISQIGRNAGEREDMEYKVAQSCVACGTHRWPDDETDLPLHVQARINEREAARAKQIEADALHFQSLNDGEQQRGEADVTALKARARNIRVAIVAPEENPEAKRFYIARPLPPVLAVDWAVLEQMQPHVDIVDVGEIVITFENAKARYRVVDEEDGIYIAELIEADQPDVDIPENWRELHHLKTIPLAKAIRRTDGSMKKDEAEAIIEEWVRTDDSNQEDDAGGNEGGGADTKGTDAAAFKDEDGNAISAEERARQAAENFDDGIDFKD